MTHIVNQLNSDGTEEGQIALTGVNPDEFVFSAQIEFGLAASAITSIGTPWSEHFIADLTPIRVDFNGAVVPWASYAINFTFDKLIQSNPPSSGNWLYTVTVFLEGQYDLVGGFPIDETGGAPSFPFTDQTFLAGRVIIDRSLSRGTLRFYYPLIGWQEFPITQSLAALTTSPDLETAHELSRTVALLDFGPGINTGTSDLSITGLNVPDASVDLLGTGFGIPAAISTTVLTTTAAFTPNSTLLYRDGILQRRGVDYTEGSDLMSLVLTDPLVGNEVLMVIYQTAVFG